MKVKHKVLSVFLAVFMVLALFGIVQATVYRKTGRVGNASGDMDSIDGATLNDGDECRVFEGTSVFLWYRLDADSGVTPDDYVVIDPNDNPGSKRWILQDNSLLHYTQKNALDYGSAYTDATLQLAITDLSTNHWSLLVNRGTWVIDANLTFAANTRLKFEEGAVFDINQSGTDPTDVVINGDLDAGLYQIFDVDANSSVAFGTGSAREYHLDWFGTGTTALSHLISACPIGGIMKLTPGTTYTGAGQYTIDKACTIDGQNAEISWASDTTASRGFLVTASNVNIYNLELDGPQDATQVSTQKGIYAYGADKDNYITDIVIKDCIIHDWGMYGVQLSFVDNFEVASNNMYDLQSGGIMCFSATDGDIHNNRVDNISNNGDAYGIEMTRTEHDSLTTHPECANINIHHNKVSNVTYWKGLGAHAGQRLTFNNNIVKNCLHGIGVGSCDDGQNDATFAPEDIIISNNIIDSGSTTGTAEYGIYLSGAYDDSNTVTIEEATGIIANNEVIGYGDANAATGCAVLLYSTNGVSCSNNIIRDAGKMAYYLSLDCKNFSILGGQIIDVWSDTGATYGINTAGENNTGLIDGVSFLSDDKSATYTNDYAINIADETGTYVTIGQNPCYWFAYILDDGLRTLRGDLVAASSSGTGEDTLCTMDIPANYLSTRKRLRVVGSGNKTGSAGNKTIKFYWGSTGVTLNAAANDTNTWRFETDIIFDTDDDQVWSWIGHNGATPLIGTSVGLTEDPTSAITMKFTGECADPNDTVVQHFMDVRID